MERKKKAVLLSSFLIIAVAFAFTGNFGTTQNSLGYIIPLYVNPSTDPGAWSNLVQLHQQNPSVPMIVVANVASGPGTSYNSAYGTQINNMESAGIRVIGYVDTCYGSRAYTGSSTTNCGTYTTGVEDDINSWYSFYPSIGGIALDKMNYCSSGYTQSTTYYSSLMSFIEGKGSNQLDVGIPGATSCASYIPTVNVIIPYEGTVSLSPSQVQAITTGIGGSLNNWGIVEHSISTAPSVSYLSSLTPYIGWIYVTDSSGYNAVPSYQSTEVANLNTVDGGSSTTSTSTNTATTTGSGGTSQTSSAVTTITTTINGTVSTFTSTSTAQALPFSSYTLGLFTAPLAFAEFVVVVLIVSALGAYVLRKD